MDVRFRGFPRAAFGFFEQLARNNNREWFQGHKGDYERLCRGPMQALVAALGGTPKNSKLSRINRDIRFSRDKSPYRTYIAGRVQGSYISLSAAGVFVGAGLYRPEPPALARYRDAVDDDKSGRALQKIVMTLRKQRYSVGTHEELVTVPRGYDPDHPRIELLRMKRLYGGKTWAPAAWLSTPRALARIEQVVKDVRPLVKWVGEHVGVRDQ
jgi:uncharacterized protein (TIGR02453 family)